MLEFFRNGGVPMFGVLICGLAALIAEIRFAMSTDERKVGVIVSLCVAALDWGVLGFVTDLMVVCTAIQKVEELQKFDVLPFVLIQGFRESLSPLILSLALLTVVWLVMAVGYRRLAPRLPAV